MIEVTLNGVDITSYVVDVTWSGSADTAGRNVTLTTVFQNPSKDESFPNVVPKIDDIVDVSYDGSLLFSGRIWISSRSTNSNTYDFTAYDSAIYLAKSKLNKKFKDITVKACLEQVANELNLAVMLAPGVNLDKVVSFIADSMTCTEIFQRALDFQSAQDGASYVVMGAMKNVVYISSNSAAPIPGLVLSDKHNVLSSSHSASLEDLINEVHVLDQDGVVQQKVKDTASISKHGKVIDLYKIDEKQNTQLEAKAMLHEMTYESSIEALGDIRVISGKVVEVEEENLKGRFLVISDSHSFSNGRYTMSLTLEFIEGGEANA